ncbi:ABC transporter permease [Herbidospora sp. NEAU-GS84]|uniref:ABC transporter permease n=1 Tax=Herbidospora solisilvae TaxID=2696284 RepID=A0A7C9J4Z7_9ACTN|nr:ABC transporter permease [Herbidospora solisilvae]NAS23980.1 ABC transporter permease [Herbidospora solisilvae]
MTGVRHLIRLILRRDRVLLPLWVLILAALPAVYAASFAELTPTEESRLLYARTTAGIPSIEAMLGPVYGHSVEALATQRAGLTLLIVALINVLVVIRHTRAEEDAGRRELVAATVVGRHAPLAAALIVAACADLVIGLLTAAFLGFSGGSLLLGMSVASAGIVFAAVGAVAAQLTENAGPARGLALAALGVAYLVRAAGDATGSDLSWASPLAWSQYTKAFAGDDWRPLLASLGLTAVLAVAAGWLSVRRDVGGGLLPTRLGPAGSTSLTGPFALAWRLQRGLLIGWSTGFLVFGLAFGGATSGAAEAFRDNAELAELFARLGGGASLTDTFIATLFGIAAIAAAAYGIQAASRMRAEESAMRAEPVLATATARVPWALGHVVFAVIGPVVALFMIGVGLGLSFGADVGDMGQVPRLIGAALAQAPAAATLTGLTVALFGLLPRLSAVAWGILAICLLLGQIGALLQLSEAVLDLSPFTHTPRLPGGEVTALPLVVLALVAVALTAAGLWGFRRRDVGV